MDILAIIPARAGSKTIRDKNILDFRGKPLFCHSIDHAKASSLITRCIVSTDSEEYASIAREAGAEVPFLRPPELATDDALDHGAFLHALQWLEEHESYKPAIVVHLRPTTPIRNPEHIDKAIQLLIDHPEADAVRSVIPAKETPYKMWRLSDGLLEPLLKLEDNPEPYNTPRQQLPLVYWQNANIDVTRRSTIIDKNSMTGEVILPFIMDVSEDIDIDEKEDFEKAEKVVS